MSNRVTISKFNPFNNNDKPELDRIETFKTFYKKRFRKLQEDESLHQKIIPQSVILKSGQIPFKRSFQKPKEDIIDIKKFQICELWSYKYNHVVQKVSKLNNVSQTLQIQRQQSKKSQKYKNQLSFDQISYNTYINPDKINLKITISDQTLPKIESFNQNSLSPNKTLTNSQNSKNKSISDFKGKLRNLIDICDNAQLFSPNKFSKI